MGDTPLPDHAEAGDLPILRPSAGRKMCLSLATPDPILLAHRTPVDKGIGAVPIPLSVEDRAFPLVAADVLFSSSLPFPRRGGPPTY
jgi:hypothetical protein